jgi:hypothetical protein
MSQTEKPFTVSDKRHFTPEGRARDEASGPPPADAASAATAAEEPLTPPPGGPADFSQFLLGLAAQAGMLLSGEGLPEGGDPREALEGARSVISILEMLKERTEGNRTSAEDALFDELLFQLRLGFVEKKRAGGA